MTAKQGWRIVTVAALAVGLLLPGLCLAKTTYEIKFGTLAPEGSNWIKVFRGMDRDLKKATGGEVGFKIYPGGIQGDEPEMLRKMYIGQLQSAGFTGNGLGEILPEIRVLEMPFIYENKAEIDHITETFYDRFDQRFREQGFVLLGWTEVGYVYFFSKDPIRTPADMQGMKIWTWESDPLARALFDELGLNPIPLPVTEVLTSLQTGMVDAVYCAPYAALGLQWFTRVNYMTAQPITNATGAVLMTVEKFEEIPEEYRADMLATFRKGLRELTSLTREDNRNAIEEMKRKGIEVIDVDDITPFRQAGLEVQQELTGELYDADLLNAVKAELERFRAEQAETE